jgi:hypothetical protein
MLFMFALPHSITLPAMKPIQSHRAQMMNSPEEQPTLVAVASPADQQTRSLDITWQVLAAHWFLISIGGWWRQGFVYLTYGKDIWGNPFHSEYLTYVGASPTSGAGSAAAIALMAAVPIAALYIFIKDKSKMKVKMYYAIAGWCILALQFYPVARQFLMSSD